jgi:hypothetical protein
MLHEQYNINELIKQAQIATAEHQLHRTLFVGESSNGLFVLPTYVDARTVTISNNKYYVGPPLLDGPRPIEDNSQVGDMT